MRSKKSSRYLRPSELDFEFDNIVNLKRKKKHQSRNLGEMRLKENINPMNNNQKILFDYYKEGKNIAAIGSPGTGKTFCLLFLMIRELLELGEFEKIVIVRSAVASRDIGFLPGNESEKVEVYEQPYKTIFNELFGRGDAYEILKQKDLISFESTSFKRGITMNNCLILIDEFQNCTFEELNTMITRCGKNAKIYFSGDIKQTDLIKKKEMSGFVDFIRILNEMKSFGLVEFKIEDCVRSGLVLEYLMARDRLGI